MDLAEIDRAASSRTIRRSTTRRSAGSARTRKRESRVCSPGTHGTSARTPITARSSTGWFCGQEGGCHDAHPGRDFLAAGAAGATALLAHRQAAAQRVTKTQVWVQLTTGGKPYPPTLQEMFLDPMFFGMEIWPIDQPASFAALLPPPPQPPQRSGARAGRQAEARLAAARNGTNRLTIRGSRAAGGRIPAMTCSC